MMIHGLINSVDKYDKKYINIIDKPANKKSRLD